MEQSLLTSQSLLSVWKSFYWIKGDVGRVVCALYSLEDDWWATVEFWCVHLDEGMCIKYMNECSGNRFHPESQECTLIFCCWRHSSQMQIRWVKISRGWWENVVCAAIFRTQWSTSGLPAGKWEHNTEDLLYLINTDTIHFILNHKIKASEHKPLSFIRCVVLH